LKNARELGTTGDIARSLHNLGFIALHQGDLESADKHLHEALNLFRQIKLERGVAECLTGFAALAAACGQPVKAAQLLAVADQMFASLGTQRWPIDQKEYDELVGDVQRRLGQDAFREAYQQSSQTSLEQAIEIFISQ
jgi:Tfp pilus assembly protein PilF